MLALAIVTGITSVVSLAPRPAGADELSDAQAKAASIQQQIQATGQQINSLSEQYDEATYKLQQINDQITQTQAQITKTQNQVNRDQALLTAQAVKSYVNAGTTSTVTDMFSSDQNTAGIRSVYSNIAAGNVNTTIANLHTAQSQLQGQQDALKTQQGQAAATQNNIETASNQAKALVAQQNQTLQQVNGQVATLIAQQQAAAAKAAADAFNAKQAAAQQQAAAQAAAKPAVQTSSQSPSTTSGGGGSGGSSGGGGGGSGAGGSVPAPSPGGSGAVAAAESQIGVPYAWGAESPGVAFDCSGLTAWAWGQAGVGLPHYSGAQFADSTPVPLSDLQPGDLLFYGPGGSDHVAMYVGGGQMIEAPYTGASVWITGVRTGDGFVGAGRP
jgi:peptidoglycan DL-endopeptidase CwlO